VKAKVNRNTERNHDYFTQTGRWSCLWLPLRLATVWVAVQEQKGWRSSKQAGASLSSTDEGFHFLMPELQFCGRAQVAGDGSGL